MDPGFFDDDDAYDEGFEDGHEDVFDTYDAIIGEDELFGESDSDQEDDDWDISGAEMGLMGALASEMSADKGRYDIDENTDQENWEKAAEATRFASRTQGGSNLRPFEQYVQDYIRRGCRHPDD